MHDLIFLNFLLLFIVCYYMNEWKHNNITHNTEGAYIYTCLSHVCSVCAYVSIYVPHLDSYEVTGLDKFATEFVTRGDEFAILPEGGGSYFYLF